MSSVAHARGIPRDAKAARRRRSFGGGVVWIVVVGVLLAGVVAINVVVLQLNVRYDRLGRERAGLRAEIAQLQAQLSSASAKTRIERLATTELGLVEATPDTTRFVELEPRR